MCLATAQLTPGGVPMSKYTRRLGASVLVAASLLAACSSDQKKGRDTTALGADTTLNRDLALAGRDTAAQPQLKDVPANAPAAPAPAAKTTPRPQTHTPARTSPRTTGNATASRPAPSTPTTSTTSSGNTVSSNPGASKNPGTAGGGAVGMIPAGATLNTHANSRICTNTNAVGDH